MLCFGPFRLEIQNTIVVFGISIVKLVKLQILMKKRYLKLGPKTLDVSVFGPVFLNTIVIFEISTVKLIELQSFVKKE